MISPVASRALWRCHLMTFFKHDFLPAGSSRSLGSSQDVRGATLFDLGLDGGQPWNEVHLAPSLHRPHVRPLQRGQARGQEDRPVGRRNARALPGHHSRRKPVLLVRSSQERETGLGQGRRIPREMDGDGSGRRGSCRDLPVTPRRSGRARHQPSSGRFVSLPRR